MTNDFSGAVVVRTHATQALSGLGVPESQWPVLTMPNTSFSQDACMHAIFQLTYTATGSVLS